MAYYRTHRPIKFKDILGQNSVRATLQGALSSGRIGHAYLLSGPRGTGKTSTARIFARALCCTNLQIKDRSAEPCGTCAACKSILNNSATDLLEIDAASNRGIEDVRELREQAKYPPVLLKKRVYIIDEVHMLTTEAFNALLKTLEEPADHVVFILATTELHKVPATIRSRCQLLRFERASVEDIVHKLQNVAKSESLTADKDALRIIAEHAQGGFRDAETLLEKLGNEHAALDAKEVRSSLGILDQDVAEAIITACLAGNSAECVSLLRKHCSQTQTLDALISALIELVRSRIGEEISSGKTPSGLYTHALQELLEAFILQKSAPYPLVALELACLNISSYQSQENIHRPSTQEPKKVAILPENEAAIQPAIPSRAPAAVITTIVASTPTVPVVELNLETINDIRKAWKEMSDEICRDNLLLGQVIKQAIFHTASEGLITIHVRFKFHADKLNEKKNQQNIQSILERISGQKWEVRYIVTDAIPRQKPVRKIADGLDEAATAVFGS